MRVPVLRPPVVPLVRLLLPLRVALSLRVAVLRVAVLRVVVVAGAASVWVLLCSEERVVLPLRVPVLVRVGVVPVLRVVPLLRTPD